MLINKVTAVVFSPTGSTKRYVSAIAAKLSSSYRVIDLTLTENREKQYTFGSDELVLFGAPVYYGRLPLLSHGLFSSLRGNNTPAVFNVVYGNREYEDALLEEQDILESQGFVGIAAGAWIGPHSFSDKIAADRPDQSDESVIEVFAANISSLLAGDSLRSGSLKVPGNRPYRDITPLPLYPTGNDSCVDCRTCVGICPTGAIDDVDPTKTDSGKCLVCMACVKECPWEARDIWEPAFKDIKAQLESKLLVVRKEPEVFFIG